MSVAADERILKRRIDDYLWRDNSPTVANLRVLLKEHFLFFNRVAIVGGMVRDFARIGKRGFKSDIDLVIDAPIIDVETLAARLNASQNKFGGYSYVTNRWKIDFWALHSTWAYREGHAKVNQLEDVTSCTFFDSDAALYDIKRRRVFCKARYFDNLRCGTIEINLLPTPSINGNLLRAVRRILLWDLEPGPRLRAFISEHLSETTFQEIAQVDRKLYTYSLISEVLDANGLQDCISDRSKRNRLATTFARQLALPGVEEKVSTPEAQ